MENAEFHSLFIHVPFRLTDICNSVSLMSYSQYGN